MTLLATVTQCHELRRHANDCDESAPVIAPALGARRGLMLTLLASGQFLMVLDVSIVNVALPAVQTELSIAESNVHYVASLYAVAFGGLLIAGGRAADRFGRRRVLTQGLVLFGLASLGTGLAPNAEWLFVGRAVLGVAAAMVSPAALSLLLTIFVTAQDRRRAMAVWGAVAAVGGVAGLLVGGLLTESLGWRWVFFIDVAPALAVAALTMQLIPESRVTSPPPTDVVGAITLLAAVAALVIALTRASQVGWSDPTVLTVAIGTVASAFLFVVVERRRPEPMIDTTLFDNITLVGSNISAAVLSALIVAQGVFVSIYLQAVADYSALETGLALVPLTAVAALASFGAGRVIEHTRLGRAMCASFVLCAAGFVLLAQIDTSSRYVTDLLPAFIVLGVGIGVGFVVFTIGATNDVADRHRGLASGLVSTSQQLGAAIGVAGLSAIAVAANDTDDGVLAGFIAAFWVGSALAIAGAVISLLTIDRPPHRTPTTDRRHQ